MSLSASAAADPADPGRRRVILVAIGLALLTLAAYAPVFANGYVEIDDADYITENPPVYTGLSAANLAWAWTTTHHGYWHPLTWMSLQLDVTFFGYHAWGMHLTNLLLHIAVCVSLFVVFARLTGEFWPSAFLAALFAVHPLHVESVAWAAERKDVLSTLFLVWTIASYAWMIERPTWTRHLVTAAVFMLGLLAKPMLVTLPFGLLLLDIWPLARVGPLAGTRKLPLCSWKQLVVEKSPLFALALAFAAVTFVLQRGVGAVINFETLGLMARIVNGLNSYVWYCWKTLVPIDLGVFYSHRFEIPLYEGLLSGALLVAVTVFFVRRFRTHPELLVGWLWFVGTLFPVSGISQSGEQARADRFAYVPHIGLFITLVWGAKGLPALHPLPRPATVVLAGSLLAAAAGLSFVQVTYWRDAPTLFEHTIAVTDRNHHAHALLGEYHLKQGDPTAAAREFRQAVRYWEKSPELFAHLGKIALDQGDLASAERDFRSALRWNYQFVVAEHDLAIVLARQEKFDEAAHVLTRLLEHAPDEASSHELLGEMELHRGKPDNALFHFRKALELDPSRRVARQYLEHLMARSTPSARP
jgi:Tfp pilus assembly protein PilF